MSDEESLSEQFEKVHTHLDYVDRTLDDIADEIEQAIEEALNESKVTVTYDLDTGSFEGKLPIGEVTRRINKRLEPPFYVKIEDDTIVINDIRREFDIDGLEAEAALQGVRERTVSVKKIVSKVEEGHDSGAPVDKVVSLLTYVGMSREKAESELEKLRRKGEIYEPATDRLRTT